MPPIDSKPPQRRPIEIAGDLARRGEAAGASVIRDLLLLAKSQEKLLASFRTGGLPSDLTLDIIRRHKHLIQE